MEAISNTYAAAGVNLSAEHKAVELIKNLAAFTVAPGASGRNGGLSGQFELDLDGLDIRKPVLVSSTDGVGTKLKLAFQLDRHDTIGIDCVAKCANDIVCVGARPLYFLDYIACGKNVPEKIEQIAAGVCDGCIKAGAELIGGETAEMPGFYSVNEYDLAGCCTGIVDKDRMINNSAMKAGDIMIALPSSGVHANGFSLVRRVFALDKPDVMALHAGNTALEGKSLGNTLIEPSRIYVKPVLALIEALREENGGKGVKGIAHIANGGFYGSIPGSIPNGLGVRIVRKAIKVLPIFELIASVGVINDHDMFSTFNMGVGMTIVVAQEDVSRALEILRANGENPYLIGAIVKSDEKVSIE